ncbi:MFS general substrate transporter, partial [Saccharata proteae CBS 121410]
PKVVSFRRDSSSHSRPSSSREAPPGMNEQSPLIDPRRSEDAEHGLKQVISPLSDDWYPDLREESKSSWYLLLLTLAGGGLQIAWSVELSYGSPYLLSLGVSKSFLALVWIAGPLSGTLVQPYVGIRSDNCRLRWGKRRPFIVGGAIATIASLFLLAWAKEIVVGILSIFGVDSASTGAKFTTIFFAVVMVYVLDFAINVIQAGIRAFVVDCAPTHQQETANAWIMRTTGTGNILGYLSGYIDLPKIFPWLGDTQMKVLCAIACFALAVTVTISCSTVQERDPRTERDPVSQEGIIAFFKSLYNSVQRLPPQVRKVCEVQLAAWIGWFPFLFYSTTYIAEIYVEPFFEANPHMSDAEITAIWDKGVRNGTLALFIFAITTFASSIFLPFVVAPTFKAPTAQPTTPLTPTTPGSISASGYFNYRPHQSNTRKRWNRLSSIFHHLQISSLTLRRAWLLSHVMFAVLMWMTILVRNTTFATILIALVGLPWAIANWAPFSLISAEISKRDAMRRGLIRAPSTRDGNALAAGEDDAADQAGVVLGIHNVAIAAPQVLATLVSSLIFRALQKPRGTPGDESVAWVLRFGGCCALLAAWLTKRVGEQGEEQE